MGRVVVVRGRTCWRGGGEGVEILGEVVKGRAFSRCGMGLGPIRAVRWDGAEMRDEAEMNGAIAQQGWRITHRSESIPVG